MMAIIAACRSLLSVGMDAAHTPPAEIVEAQRMAREWKRK
jgi:hypothetical protein